MVAEAGIHLSVLPFECFLPNVCMRVRTRRPARVRVHWCGWLLRTAVATTSHIAVGKGFEAAVVPEP